VVNFSLSSRGRKSMMLLRMWSGRAVKAPLNSPSSKPESLLSSSSVRIPFGVEARGTPASNDAWLLHGRIAGRENGGLRLGWKSGKFRDLRWRTLCFPGGLLSDSDSSARRLIARLGFSVRSFLEWSGEEKMSLGFPDFLEFRFFLTIFPVFLVVFIVLAFIRHNSMLFKVFPVQILVFSQFQQEIGLFERLSRSILVCF
jgi:hypothetical protein